MQGEEQKVLPLGKTTKSSVLIHNIITYCVILPARPSSRRPEGQAATPGCAFVKRRDSSGLSPCVPALVKADHGHCQVSLVIPEGRQSQPSKVPLMVILSGSVPPAPQECPGKCKP